jgi:N-acetylmuramoyl-L-alanine amidase
MLKKCCAAFVLLAAITARAQSSRNPLYARPVPVVPASETSGEQNVPPVSEEILPGGLRIKNKPIEFGSERTELTIAYRRRHQDPAASDIFIDPRMIILHWTGINSFSSTWKYFNRTRAEADRAELAAAGEVNVSAQFLVDRDGTVYRLMPETWMARHCIGLNHVAIGIENVGDGEKFPVTQAQAQANAALVRYLAGKYPISHLIGHMEYRRMEGTPFFLELDAKYRNTKPDPGADFMERVRTMVADLNLEGPPSDKH